MQAKQEAPEWAIQQRQRQAQLLIKEGFLQQDEFGDVTVTEKGHRRASARLDKLPPGDDILIEALVCQAHEIPLRMD